MCTSLYYCHIQVTLYCSDSYTFFNYRLHYTVMIHIFYHICADTLHCYELLMIHIFYHICADTLHCYDSYMLDAHKILLL